MPLIKIGDEFGGKDHSSVINAFKNVEKNSVLMSDVKKIMERINN